eukprot:m.392038 g.392038  ORF g.392038 m.392038 type:complete len:325 (-) comp20082_c1_seq15:1722-2696(-)
MENTIRMLRSSTSAVHMRLQGQVARSQQECQTLREEISILTRDLETWRLRCMEKDTELEKERLTHKQVTDLLQSARELCQQQSQQLEDAQHSSRSLSETLEQRNTELADLECWKGHVEPELKQLKTQLEKLQQRAAQERGTAKAMEQRATHAEDKLRHAQSQLEEARGACSQARAALEEQAKTEQHTARLQQQLSDAQHDHTQLGRQIEHERQTHVDALRAVQEELANTKSKLQDETASRLQVRTQVEQLEMLHAQRIKQVSAMQFLQQQPVFQPTNRQANMLKAKMRSHCANSHCHGLPIVHCCRARNRKSALLLSCNRHWPN